MSIGLCLWDTFKRSRLLEKMFAEPANLSWAKTNHNAQKRFQTRSYFIFPFKDQDFPSDFLSVCWTYSATGEYNEPLNDESLVSIIVPSSAFRGGRHEHAYANPYMYNLIPTTMVKIVLLESEWAQTI